MMNSWGVAVEQVEWRKGPWIPEEDKLLTEYVRSHGEGRWSSVAKSTGLNRCAKSCRLRWVNYLKPGLKRGPITPLEEGIIIELHALWGNKWSTIARYLPGRTDNEIKNYWRTHFKKRAKPSEKQERKYTRRSLHDKQQEQQQQQEKNNMNVNVVQGKVMDEPQAKQEVEVKNLTSPHSSSPITFQADVASSWWDILAMDGLWGDLWNFDQPQHHYNSMDQQQPSDCTKTAIPNQAHNVPYSCEDDVINDYNA